MSKLKIQARKDFDQALDRYLDARLKEENLDAFSIAEQIEIEDIYFQLIKSVNYFVDYKKRKQVELEKENETV